MPYQTDQLADLAIDAGTPGGSARLEFEHRMAVDMAEHRDRMYTQTARIQRWVGDGWLGRWLVRAFVDDRFRQGPSTRAWRSRAEGEEEVAGWLDALEVFGVVTLHDRVIPGARSNIDHLVVTPWGVYVIDSRRYVGRFPERTADDGLMVDGRRRDGLTNGVRSQCEPVRQVLGADVPVRGMLCFVDASWPRSGRDFDVRGVRVCWPERLRRELLSRSSPIVDVPAVAAVLAEAFPPVVPSVPVLRDDCGDGIDDRRVVVSTLSASFEDEWEAPARVDA